MFYPEHLPTTPSKLDIQLVALFAVYPSSAASAPVEEVHQSMDVLISVIAGDLVSRSASFMISKYFQKQPGIDKILQRPERVVLRIDTVIEEAEGRHITNQGMLCQLRVLRQGMYRGRCMLDALRFQAALDKEEASHSSSVLSKSSPAKRLCLSHMRSGSSNREELFFGIDNNMREEVQQMVDTLEDTMDGIKEFIFFLELYPRILRQPYGTYLILDNCMFGRQTEREQVLNFLLCPNATPDLAVLPIIGPIRVGKSTLVEYVCRDESVRSHFSMILFFPEDSLKDEGVINHFRITCGHKERSPSQITAMILCAWSRSNKV